MKTIDNILGKSSSFTKGERVIYDGGVSLTPFSNKKITVPNKAVLTYLGKKDNKHYFKYINSKFYTDDVFFNRFIKKYSKLRTLI